MANITREQLEKIIQETLFSKESTNITIGTDRGGMKETLKAFCEAWGLEYTWTNMRKMYRFLLRTGSVEKYGEYYILR